MACIEAPTEITGEAAMAMHIISLESPGNAQAPPHGTLQVHIIKNNF